jgi:hypothetical protein
MWHVDDHLRRLLHWLPSDPIVAVLVVVLALVAFLLAAWKCVTDSLCLGLIGNRRTILRHSCLGIGVFSLVVGGGGWLCQSPAYLEKVRFALLLLIAVGFVLKFIDTVRSFVAVMRAGLLPISTLRLLSGLWFLIVASFAGFAALLWLHSPVPKPLLLLALVWIWPAGELFRCVINLSANRHR